MKSQIINSLGVLLLLLFFAGCEDYLDPQVITYENYEQVTSSYNSVSYTHLRAHET